MFTTARLFGIIKSYKVVNLGYHSLGNRLNDLLGGWLFRGLVIFADQSWLEFATLASFGATNLNYTATQHTLAHLGLVSSNIVKFSFLKLYLLAKQIYYLYE